MTVHEPLQQQNVKSHGGVRGEANTSEHDERTEPTDAPFRATSATSPTKQCTHRYRYKCSSFWKKSCIQYVMEHIYVVRVRSNADSAPAAASVLLPSERRYSALTVGGLFAGHLVLGAVEIILASLAIAWDPHVGGGWADHMGAGLVAGVGAILAAIAALPAWLRWYEDHHLGRFYIATICSFGTAVTAVLLSVAALVHLHESRSPQWTPPELDPGDLVKRVWAEHGARQLRTSLAANTLIASLLETCWSWFGARLAWRGMHTEDSVRSWFRGTAAMTNSGRGAADGKVDDKLQEVVADPAQLAQSHRARPPAPHMPHDATNSRLAIPGGTQCDSGPDLPRDGTMGYEERVARFLDRSHGTEPTPAAN